VLRTDDFGGRCNFTNVHAGPENFLSKNRDFCRSALARYTPWNFIGLVEKHGIAYHEKKLGQQFCNGSSRAIIAMLLDECRAAKVHIRCDCHVTDVRKSDRFHVGTQTESLACDSLIIATGGLSFAKLGATDFGYRTASQFGLRVTELRPGLVPLTFDDGERAHFQKLSGISLPVIARAGSASFSEAILFTHRRLSGPAILQISSYLRDHETVSFLHHYNARELRDLDTLLHHWPLQFSGTEGYPNAEVTLGGVDTSELSSKTLESRNVRGLFFIWEVVDVTGWFGGYNFQ
jgi:predicted Rossmann fold flavoprotein